MARALFLFASLASLAHAQPNIVQERRDVAPPGFVHVDLAPIDHILTLRIGVTQSNVSGLIDALYAVSTPGGSQYGKHLSSQAAHAFAAPDAHTSSAVQAWLASHNLTAAPATPAGDWLRISLSVAQANKLLYTNFSIFEHQASGKRSVRTLAYSLPADLKAHVNFVHPTTTFPTYAVGKQIIFEARPAPARFTASGIATAPASCATAVTPACLQDLYGIPSRQATQSSNVIAVAGFSDQYANEADLQAFLAMYRPDLPANTAFATVLVNGGSDPQTPGTAGTEGDLDTEYTVGVAGGVPVQFVSVGDPTGDELDSAFAFIEFLLSEEPMPKVMTMSYSVDEASISFSIANQLCYAIAQLGARGMSLFASSGDGGVAGHAGPSCTNFAPTFPGSCPFMTSVGSTNGLPETAANFSSGGFSNYFSTPGYQIAEVRAFQRSLNGTYAGLYNTSGRGFPDVSALGRHVEIVWRGLFGTAAGTSCSTPITASLFAMLNDELISAGRPSLGFLNPFIYAHRELFTDITSGNNPGCNTTGFNAGKGWDPARVGTPVYSRLRSAVGL
ncbi:family S53 protease [Auriscalpium vulgare]|uniref:Family S53 protease n=1 Tax=Auriscalpium vulgare TaxID=40419 RepID=A0ACB8RPH1_9AGAM|nr:family S53 protease [Auriscalpium vulgare]